MPKEINVKTILRVINATYAVAKRKPEKIRLADKPLSRTNLKKLTAFNEGVDLYNILTFKEVHSV